MTKTLGLVFAATFATATLAHADEVIIRQTDPEPTNIIIIKEKQDPDVVIKKEKIIIREDNDAGCDHQGSISVD